MQVFTRVVNWLCDICFLYVIIIVKLRQYMSIYESDCVQHVFVIFMPYLYYMAEYCNLFLKILNLIMSVK